MNVKMRPYIASISMMVLFVTCIVSGQVSAATLEGGKQKLVPGESAIFQITAPSKGSSDLHARCEISEVGGSASLTFDGENYVPLSEPGIGDVITLSRSDVRQYNLSGVVNGQVGGSYIAFHYTGEAAAICFPGMDCSGASAQSSSVTISCEDVS